MTLIRLLALCLVLLTAAAVRSQDDAAVAALYEDLQSAPPRYSVREERVEFENEGQRLVGMLALPDGGDGPFPVALLFHGFTADREGLPVLGTDETMHGRTARMLAEHGIASLRIDFRGSGESGGAWEDTSFSAQIDDALAALDVLETLPAVDSGRVGLLGFSQGGLVAVALAARDARVDSVVLWSAVSHPPLSYGFLLGPDVLHAGLTADVTDVQMPWGAWMRLGRAFFEDLYRVNPVAEIRGYDGPLLVIGGQRDMTVAPMPYAADVFLIYHDGPERLVMMDSDHVFGVDSSGPAVLDDAIRWSLAWLLHTLDGS